MVRSVPAAERFSSLSSDLLNHQPRRERGRLGAGAGLATVGDEPEHDVLARRRADELVHRGTRERYTITAGYCGRGEARHRSIPYLFQGMDLLK